MYDAKISSDGSISGYVIDYYDFEKLNYISNNFDLFFNNIKIQNNTKNYLKNELKNTIIYINNNAFRQQNNNQIVKYIILVPIILGN